MLGRIIIIGFTTLGLPTTARRYRDIVLVIEQTLLYKEKYSYTK